MREALLSQGAGSRRRIRAGPAYYRATNALHRDTNTLHYVRMPVHYITSTLDYTSQALRLVILFCHQCIT